MRAIGQITITNICDVVAGDTAPDNPYVGQLWVDTSVSPPETKIWNGEEWIIQNDVETLRTTISVLTTKSAELQSTIDGLNSYVGSMTETIETLTDSLGSEQQTVLEMQAQMSQLQQTIEGLSVRVTNQYAGGMNFIQNSAGLNGISDDWVKSGTVTVDSSTDTQNNTASDSCFVLGTSSTLKQTVTGLVTGQSYAFSLRAKKTYSGYTSYIYVKYNGNKYAYFFNQTTTFGWTDFNLVIDDITDSTVVFYIYNRYASLYVSDIMMVEGSTVHNWTPAPNEIYTNEVKIDKRGIEVSNSASSQRTVITNTEFAGYYDEEVIFTLNKDETQTKKTTVDGELTVGKTKFVPMSTASEGLNIVVLD